MLFLKRLAAAMLISFIALHSNFSRHDVIRLITKYVELKSKYFRHFWRRVAAVFDFDILFMLRSETLGSGKKDVYVFSIVRCQFSF